MPFNHSITKVSIFGCKKLFCAFGDFRFFFFFRQSFKCVLEVSRIRLRQGFANFNRIRSGPVVNFLNQTEAGLVLPKQVWADPCLVA